MKKISTLREELEKFCYITEKLIKAIEEEQEEVIDELFVSRQEIINHISSFQYTKEEFVKYSEELELKVLTKTLENVMHSKRDEIKEKISQLREHKSANKSYVQNSNINNNYLNKRV